MKQSRIFLSIFSIAVAAALLLSGPASAQTTTSSIRVVVTDDNGAAAAGVPIDVLHVPTGRVATSSTNSSGVASVRNLAVGGPYQVSISSGSSFSGQAISDIITQLDETEVVALRASSTIEEIKVVAQQTSQAIQVGVGRNFDRATITYLLIL